MSSIPVGASAAVAVGSAVPVAGLVIGAISLAAQLGSGIAKGIQNKKAGEETRELADIQRQDILRQNAFTNSDANRRLALKSKGIQHDRTMAELSNTLRMDQLKTQQQAENLATMNAANLTGLTERAASVGRNFNMIDRIGGTV